MESLRCFVRVLGHEAWYTLGMSVGAVVQHIREVFESEQVTWLQRLVDVPSCTRAKTDVEQAALILDAKAEALGLRCERVPDPKGVFADHRVYSTAAALETPAIGLVGHVDTVFPRSMGFLTFEREGDVIRGPGVLDMKSGLSVIVFALSAIQQADPEAYAKLAVRFICVSDEEVGSPSSASLFRRIAPSLSAALVFEAGRVEDRIVTRRKGGAFFKIRVQGRAAHAGNRHREGISAIHGLSLLVPRIEALTDYTRGLTLNVGLIEGGSAKNTVPEFASCDIDGRFLEPADGPYLERALASLIADPIGPDVPEKLQGLIFTLEGGVTRPPMVPTEATQQLRKMYEIDAAEAGLRVGEAPQQGGGSDANLLAAEGVPSIDGLGPFGRHFHRREEWSSLQSLRMRTEALASFLLRANNAADLRG